MLSFFGVSSSAAGSVSSTEPSHGEQRALPASWYRSAPMYELERRAIFSQKWLMITHKLRFVKAGDYVSFEQAGFSLFLVMDRDGNVNGFHNICRHRAYPVVNQDSGNASILACKYHGWSYGFKGNLAKAPRFETVPGFDKSKHGLLPVHVHIDALGFIWVNLEASSKPSVPWEADFAGVDTQPRLAIYGLMKNYHFDHAWTAEGHFNWKTLADNYNECYHCPTGHPGVAAVADISKYYVETKAGHIQHFNTNKDEDDDGVRVRSTFLFPNAAMTVTPHFFYLLRCVPVSASMSRMEYEVYRHNSASDEEFNRIDSFYKQVLEEDKGLCNAAQRNLNGGIFINGQLHPEKEKGPLYFQKTIRELVMSHRAREENENGGAEIWPASPVPTGPMKTDKLAQEERFCAGLGPSGCSVMNSTGPDRSLLSW